MNPNFSIELNFLCTFSTATCSCFSSNVDLSCRFFNSCSVADSHCNRVLWVVSNSSHCWSAPSRSPRASSASEPSVVRLLCLWWERAGTLQWRLILAMKVSHHKRLLRPCVQRLAGKPLPVYWSDQWEVVALRILYTEEVSTKIIFCHFQAHNCLSCAQRLTSLPEVWAHSKPNGSSV